MTVVMVTPYVLDRAFGSTVRPLRQFQSLKIKEIDIDLMTLDHYQGNGLVHAHQHAIYSLDNYIADIHGLHWKSIERFAKWGMSYFKEPLKKTLMLFRNVSQQKKKDIEAYKKALHLVCAGESIAEELEKLNDITIVRNALDLEEYQNCRYGCGFSITVVGEFLETNENYYCRDMLTNIVKRTPDILFKFIGQYDKSWFLNFAPFPNVQQMGFVEDYSQVLRNCSVMLLPYPKYCVFGGTKNKLLEAAASSMPIITTEWGRADFPKEFLCLSNDVAGIIEHIYELKEDENLRKYFGYHLRRIVEERNDIHKETDKLVKLYGDFV